MANVFTMEYDKEKALEAINRNRLYSGKTITLVELGETDIFGETHSGCGRVFNILINNEESGDIIKITRSEIYKKDNPSDTVKYSVLHEAQILEKLIGKPNIMQIRIINTASNYVECPDIQDNKGNNAKLYFFIAERLSPLTLDDTFLVNGRFNRPLLCNFILDISQAIYNLQNASSEKNLKWTHRDIKLSNILFKEENGRKEFKLADFGTVKPVKVEGPTQIGNEAVISPDCWAPETIVNKETIALDIYGIGCCIYRLLSINHASIIEASGGNDVGSVYSMSYSNLLDYYRNENRKALYPKEELFDNKHLRYGSEDKELVQLLKDMLNANYNSPKTNKKNEKTNSRISLKDLQICLFRMIGVASKSDYECYSFYNDYAKTMGKDKHDTHRGDTMTVQSHVATDQESQIGKPQNNTVELWRIKKPIGIILFFAFLIEAIGAIFFASWPFFNPENFSQIFTGDSANIVLLCESLKANHTVNLIVLIATVFLRLIVLSTVLVFVSRPKTQNIEKKLDAIVSIAGAVCFVISIVCYIIEYSLYSQMSIIGVSLRCALLCSPIVVAAGYTESKPSIFYDKRNENTKISNKWIWTVYLCITVSSLLLLPIEYLCGLSFSNIYKCEGFWDVFWHIIGATLLGVMVIGIGIEFYSIANFIMRNSITYLFVAPDTADSDMKFRSLTHVDIISGEARTLKHFAACKKLEVLSAKAKEDHSADSSAHGYNLSYNGAPTGDHRWDSTVDFSSPNLNSLSINGFSLTGTLAGFEELEHLTELSLVNCGIKEIDSISNLKHLVTVDLSNNNISDLSSSWYWDSLGIKYFSCSNNKIDDLSRVILTVLRTFKGNNNQFTDLSFLDKNAETLEECDISDNPLSQESINAALRNCKALESLTIGNRYFINGISVPIQSIDFLRGCTKLKKLSATWGTISDLSPLNCHSLVYLDLSNNQISDVSQLANAFDDTENPTLILHDNSIQSILGIPKMVYGKLDLSSNRIIDFSPLEGIFGQELLISYPFGYSVSELPQCEIDKEFLKQISCLKRFTKISIDHVPPEMVARIEERLSFLGISPEQYSLDKLLLTD